MPTNLTTAAPGPVRTAAPCSSIDISTAKPWTAQTSFFGCTPRIVTTATTDAGSSVRRCGRWVIGDAQTMEQDHVHTVVVMPAAVRCDHGGSRAKSATASAGSAAARDTGPVRAGRWRTDQRRCPASVEAALRPLRRKTELRRQQGLDRLHP